MVLPRISGAASDRGGLIDDGNTSALDADATAPDDETLGSNMIDMVSTGL